MPHAPLFLILAILSLSVAFGAEGDKPLPYEVTKAQEAYEKNVTSIHNVYAKAEQKIREDALKSLEKTKGDYVKKADLEGALLVDSYIKKMKEGEVLTALEAKLNEKKDILGGAVVNGNSDPILGQWSEGEGTRPRWEFKADGTGLHNGGPKTFLWEPVKGKLGTYKLTISTPRQLVLLSPKTAVELVDGAKIPLIKIEK